MHDARYRPRSASEIVDAGFGLLRAHYRAFITITAVTYAPVLVTLLVLQRALGVDPSAPDEGYAIFLGVSGLLTLVWYALASGALTLAASDAYAARPIVPAAALRGGAARLGASVAAMLVVYLSVTLAVLLIAGVGGGFATVALRGLSPVVLVLAGIVGVGLLLALVFYLLTRWFAVPTAHMIEGIGPFAGLRRSWRLADDDKWRLFGTLALLWIIYLMLTVGFSVAGALAGPAVAQVMSAVVAVLVYPLLPVSLTVLYFDARIRREGYDIELLERELGAPAADAPSSEQPAY